MRYATLYEVTEKQVPMQGKNLVVQEWDATDLFSLADPRAPVPESTAVRLRHIPFERVAYPDGTERFLAIHPDLRELLEVPILHDARVRAEQEQRQERQHLQRRLEVEVATIQRFERAPLWRRLLAAWKGQL